MSARNRRSRSNREHAVGHGPRGAAVASSGTTSPLASPREGAAPGRCRSAWEWLAAHGLLVTLIVALLVRLIHWWNVRHFDPLYNRTLPETDMHTYWEWAKSLVAGDWLSRKQGVFYYGPLYPYFLALLFRVFGESYDVVHGIQALIGVIAPVAIWDVARRLWGRSEALVAGLLAALSGPILFYEQLLLMEGLLVAIHACLLWCLVRGTLEPERAWRYAALAGVLSALACFGRGNFLLVGALLIPGWWVAIRLVASLASEGEHSAVMRSSWRAALAFAASFGSLLFLSLLRNRIIGGQWVLTTGNGPILLYIGNAPDSFGIFHYPDSFHALKERYGGDQSLVPWSRELLAAILAEPLAFLRNLGRKAWMFFSGYDIADNSSYYLNERFSWVLRVNPITWELVLALGAVGIWCTWRNWRRQFLVYLYAASFAVSIILVFVVGRYRLEFLLPMCLWAGAGLVELARDLATRSWGSFARGVGLAVALTVALQPRWSPAVRINSPPTLKLVRWIRPNDYVMMARAMQLAGREEEAFALLGEGAAMHPWDPACARGYAAELRKRRRPAEAAEILRRYLSFFGNDLDAATEFAYALGEAGRIDEANRVVERILQLSPDHPQARVLQQKLTTLQQTRQ
ncbi:MAG: glycosyltransferase family 39 protein [Candidatus Sumerlaea chitinivorans]|nr:glycosyltransferase family 39 protein [Candidatus Sumerlaea chitinivorans]